MQLKLLEENKKYLYNYIYVETNRIKVTEHTDKVIFKITSRYLESFVTKDVFISWNHPGRSVWRRNEKF